MRHARRASAHIPVTLVEQRAAAFATAQDLDRDAARNQDRDDVRRHLMKTAAYDGAG